MRHGQFDQLDPENVQMSIGTAVDHGEGAHRPRTGSAGEIPRDRVLVAGENDAVVAVQSDENVAGAVGQRDGGRDEKAARPQKTRYEIAGEDSQGQRRDRKVRAFSCCITTKRF